jgi:Fe-S-cluster containining protein
MSTAASLPAFLENKRRMAEEDTFSFACHPGVPCFNTCCADVNIMLTPLDVLQLARTTGMHTRRFLETHTINPITKALQLPVVMLKMVDDEGRRCPFVGESGCTVYENRPWACRMYPLGMAIPPARVGEEPEPLYFLFEDDHCQGRFERSCRQWTAREWRTDQNIAERDELETGFRELVSHPWFIGGRHLDPKRMEMFYMGCYDLDTFRTFVLESSFTQRFELEPELLDALANDDMALLTFAFRWLRFALFAEPTMKVRDKLNSRSQP